MRNYISDLKVLVAEDTDPSKKHVVTVLKIIGIDNVYSATNIDHAFAVYQANQPDIIIVDWDKSFNGIDLVEKIRKEKNISAYKNPIILMSTDIDDIKVKTARNAGITEYLVKPFTAKDLERRIAYVNERKRPFLELDEYIGPDRRRYKKPDFDGPYKRNNDKKD